MQELTKTFMDNNLRITGIVILCVSTCLLVPKIALSNLAANGMSHTDSTNFNSQKLQDTYIPPDYGVPDSQHGSGTR